MRFRKSFGDSDSGSSRIEPKDLDRSIRRKLILIAALVACCVGIAQIALPQEPSKIEQASSSLTTEDCMGCHQEAIGSIAAVSVKSLHASPHKELGCPDCHTSISDAPHTPAMLKIRVACADCHSEIADSYHASAHGRPDKVAGDHPTCLSCHAGADPHQIKAAKDFTRADKVLLCSSCHSQLDRMGRYNVDPDAVPSYDASFHGKALMRFHKTNVAICTDCHTTHSMLPPSDPRAPTNRANAGALCSKPECHAGANVNFAMSGANHLRLKLKSDPILHGFDLFFRILVGSVVIFLLSGTVLDIRFKVFGANPPHAGRTIGFLISLAFFMATCALGLAMFSYGPPATWLTVGAVGAIVLAFLIYFIKRPPKPPVDKNRKLYKRFTTSQRIQHWFLALCFILLIGTGLPLHFPDSPWLGAFYGWIGGIEVARTVHRTAAVGLIGVWCYHVGELFVKWARTGFSLSALTMLPNWQDAKDFVTVSRMYLGLGVTKEPPHDRFQFRQKLDYLAEYWGVPVMVISGFIMWFPIYWGNRLREEAISASIVAHGWEATLAFLAIILWHLYQESLNPDAFPIRKVIVTGALTREEMEEEHLLELQRIESQNKEPKTGEATS